MELSKSPLQLQEIELRVPGIPGTHVALDTEERWNGAVCPLFDRRQAEDFARAFADAGPNHEAWYDENQDAFCFDSPERAKPECFPSVTRDGISYYPIGARCWIWMKS